jgi:hypothetical protein
MDIPPPGMIRNPGAHFDKVGNITKKRSTSKGSGNYRSRSTTKPVTPKFIPLGSKVSMTMGKVIGMQKSNRALLTPALEQFKAR